MKKNIIRLLACAMGVVCMMSLAACGGNNNSSAAKGDNSSAASGVESSQPASSEAASSAAAGGLNANGKYNTVEDFVNSDLMQSQFESMKSQLEGDDDSMSIDLSAEGNKLIYSFTYSAEALEGVDTDTLATTLDSAMDSMASTFEGIASSLKDAVDVDDPVVEVTYYTSDGTELCSREFTPAE